MVLNSAQGKSQSISFVLRRGGGRHALPGRRAEGRPFAGVGPGYSNDGTSVGMQSKALLLYYSLECFIHTGQWIKACAKEEFDDDDHE
jgi:hypothetical protein